MNEWEEGSMCPNCNVGELVLVRMGDCSCHISPPCWACTQTRLVCPECFWEEGDD